MKAIQHSHNTDAYTSFSGRRAIMPTQTKSAVQNSWNTRTSTEYNHVGTSRLFWIPYKHDDKY